MQKFFGMAFGSSSRTRASSRAAESRGFAVLPQQTEDELALSEAHSKLDTALKFLSQDVGYTLLDDARLSGGAVRLKPPPQRKKDVRSARIPKETPKVEDPHKAEMDAAKLEITPGAARYAHYEEDLMLVSRFTNYLAESNPAAMSKVKHEELYKTVLQGIKLMHLCDYDYSDVVLVLAYASVYFKSVFSDIGHKMSEHEAAHVCVLLIYLAHSFVLDETCPLRCWQKHIFRKYCTLKVLDAALFRLFKMRKFLLRVTESEEQVALQHLFGHSHPGLANGHPNGLPNGLSNGSASHHHDAAAGREPARPPRPG